MLIHQSVTYEKDFLSGPHADAYRDIHRHVLKGNDYLIRRHRADVWALYLLRGFVRNWAMRFKLSAYGCSRIVTNAVKCDSGL